MIHKIYHRWNYEKVVAEIEAETLLEAVEKLALSGAYLRGTYPRGTNLGDVREDFCAVLSAVPAEVPALREALLAGKIDGSTYSGDCACLVGTIANARLVEYSAIPELKPNSERPAERWFLAIRRGDTPESNQVAAIALSWIDEWTAERTWPKPLASVVTHPMPNNNAKGIDSAGLRRLRAAIKNGKAKA